MKKRIAVSGQKLRVGFKGYATRTDEGILDPQYSPYTVNFTFRGGVLKSDIGIEKAQGYINTSPTLRFEYPSLPEGEKIHAIFAYNRKSSNNGQDDRIVVQTTSGSLKYIRIFVNGDIWHTVPDFVASGTIYTVNYNYNGDDVLLICSSGENFTILNDDTVTKIAAAPLFSSLAVHNERIYGTVSGKENQVWFSDDFDPANWNVSLDEAGFINFADECGDVLKVVSFLNYLYVFREHGISRLTAYGDQEEYSLKKVFTGIGKIYKDTIVFCGDRIIFLADEGLCTFDGYDVRRTAANMPEPVDKRLARGAYLGSAYYLACTLDYEELDIGIFRNNAIIEYIVPEDNVSVLGGYNIWAICASTVHQASDLLISMGNNVLCRKTATGSVHGVATRKEYRSADNVLMTDRTKIVRDITLTTATDLTVQAILDGKTTTYELKGSELPQKVHIERSGDRVAFRLICEQKDAYVTPPIVNLELL